MCWQKEQMQPFGKHQITILVPARLIHHEKQVFVWPSPLFFGEGAEGQRTGLSIDGRHEQPTGFSTLRLDKAIQVPPLIALSDHCSDSAPFACPDAAQEGFEADVVLILAPHLNLSLWILLSQLLNLLWEVFKSLLCGLVALLMLRAWHTRAVAQALQILPATALVDRPSQTLSHPGCHFGAAPETAIGRRLI
jgi:hypothetical protein